MKSASNHIKQLREDFAKGSLNESSLAPDPFKQFDTWLKQALEAEISEVQAMTLSTGDINGKISSRIVYLREYDHRGFCFYTNYNSEKGQQIAANPNVSLCFFWKELERQVRITGQAEKLSADQSDAYFNGRPYDSKIGAWASNQSESLVSREELDHKISLLKKQFTPETIQRPDYWGGYRVVADKIEFWQGRPSRLHDRMCYTLQQPASWKIERLSP